MPADRFIHPRLGHSDKVTLLTDLEFRVWIQFILSADDFGVMRLSAVTVQADNDHLANRRQKDVQRCLERLVPALCVTFEHQGRTYICQRDWQSFQKVEYPRPTFEPKPPAALLETFDAATQELFRKHPGGLGRRGSKVSPSSADGSANGSRTVPDYAGAQTRETANGLRLASKEGEPERKPDLEARSGRPIFKGQRLTVFEWMLDDCRGTLGEHMEPFDIHSWFFDLDARAVRDGLVIPKRDGGAWLQAQLVAEAQRRGLPLAMASTSAVPQVGKLTSRMAAMVAGAKGQV